MLAFKINKNKFEALSDEVKKEYIAGDSDGEFVLDVGGLPTPEDTGPLKRALESEKTKSKDLKSKLDDANLKLSEAPNIDELKATHDKEVGKYKTFTEKTLIDSAALKLATEISNSPVVMAKIIKERLATDLTGDEPKTVILGPDGKPSADFTIDKLKTELLATKDYSNILLGSKASGGGAPKLPVKPGGGSTPTGEQSADTPNLSKMSPSDLAAHLKAKKAADAGAE